MGQKKSLTLLLAEPAQERSEAPAASTSAAPVSIIPLPVVPISITPLPHSRRAHRLLRSDQNRLQPRAGSPLPRHRSSRQAARD